MDAGVLKSKNVHDVEILYVPNHYDDGIAYLVSIGENKLATVYDKFQKYCVVIFDEHIQKFVFVASQSNLISGLSEYKHQEILHDKVILFKLHG